MFTDKKKRNTILVSDLKRGKKAEARRISKVIMKKEVRTP